ncbi:MAG: hypothetical protein ACSLFI_10440 [Solirubrobacterales bacterium]
MGVYDEDGSADVVMDGEAIEASDGEVAPFTAFLLSVLTPED